MIGSDDSLPCIGLDTADKELILSLPQIKAFVTLVSTISNACISGRKYLTYKWPFSALAFSEEYLSRNTPVQIETDMRPLLSWIPFCSRPNTWKELRRSENHQ